MRTLALVLLALLATNASAQRKTPTFTLSTARGVVETVKGNKLTLRVEAGSNRTRALTLKLIGTSKLTSLAPRRMDGKLVLTQRSLQPKSLKAKQVIAVVYTRLKGETVLLHGVANLAR